MHIKAVSAVGNVAYLHQSFSYDEHAPAFDLSAELPEEYRIGYGTLPHTKHPTITLKVTNITETNIDKIKITSTSNFVTGPCN